MASDTTGLSAGRNDALDALRGIAITMVLLYHLPGQPLNAGLIGVDLFMVLSGYLVTKSFMGSRMRALDVLEFWQRRIRRVVAPALVLVIVVLILRSFTWRVSPRDDYWDAAAAAGFVSNWRFVLSGTDYFRTVSGVSPFQHLWSLSVEEQFYIVWPVLFVLFKRRIKAATGALILLSFGLMAVLAQSGEMSRSYFGTDTRAGTLLVGAMLAVASHEIRRLPFHAILSSPILFNLMLIAYLLMSFFLSGTSPYMYQGGFAVIAALGAVLVLNAEFMPNHGRSVFRSRLLFRGLTAIGLRSYSIYLVHWPVIVMLSPRFGEDNEFLRSIALIILSLLLSEIMYRCVERRLARRMSLVPRVSSKLVAASVAVSVGTIGVGFASSGLPVFLRGGDSVQLTAETETRVLFVGDSVVMSLVDLGLTKSVEPGVGFDHVAISGCGLLPGLVIDEAGGVYEPSRACANRAESEFWNKIQPDSYDLVVWLSPWDAENRRFNQENATQIASPERFVAEMSKVAERLGQVGKRVAVVTAPERAAQSASDSQGPSLAVIERYRAANHNLREAASRSSAEVIDLNSFVCSGMSPCPDVDRDGNRFRPIDGVHFSGLGGGAAVKWLQNQVIFVLEN